MSISKARSHKRSAPTFRVGFDIGGTFTDVVMVTEGTGAVHYAKVPSTPASPDIAALQGIEQALARGGASPADVTYLVHGSTVSANAVLQNKGARTGIITTRGFRDLLEIGRVSRGHSDESAEDVLYNINYVKPPPLVPRRFRLEVPERVGAGGEIVTPLDEAATVKAIEELHACNIESIAVCFLNSYANPAHERRVKELIQRYYPEAWISVSSEILSQSREYERFSTTALNAYVMPPLNRYLTRLEEGLAERGIRAPLHIMQATGGVTTASMARIKSVHTALSGFVGGVMGGAFLARLAGFRNVITLDIGGTSTDISLIRRGKPEITTDGRLGTHPVQIPIVSVRTIGAGGGSIARVGSDGLLKVGPQSAGADPGPACYARQGAEATVTDANVCLGRMQQLLDGALPLEPKLARDVVNRRVAEGLDLSEQKTASGIIAVQNANIARAIRANTVERGVDPRDCVLAAYGGAGPLHADEIAQSLGIPTVVVPPYAGVLSAMGLLSSDVRHDESRAWAGLLAQTAPEALEQGFGELEAKLSAEMAEGGINQRRIRFTRSLGLRYVGQGYEIAVALKPGKLSRKAMLAAATAFHKRHAELYRHSSTEEPVELVSLSVTAVVAMTRPRLARSKVQRNSAAPHAVSTRTVAFGSKPEPIKCKVYRRETLRAGQTIKGPAIVEQFDSTTVIAPRSRASVDAFGNLIVAVGGIGVR
jgi:N-methylhydantoinase A